MKIQHCLQDEKQLSYFGRESHRNIFFLCRYLISNIFSLGGLRMWVSVCLCEPLYNHSKCYDSILSKICYHILLERLFMLPVGVGTCSPLCQCWIMSLFQDNCKSRGKLLLWQFSALPLIKEKWCIYPPFVILGGIAHLCLLPTFYLAKSSFIT